MTFWDYLNTTQARELKGVTQGLAERLAELIGRGHSVADLLAHYGDDFGHLPAARLQSLARARRNWQIWRKRKQQFEDARRNAKLPPLPAAVAKSAPTPHALDAVARAARFCPRSTVADDEAWLDVLRAGAELWNACIGLCRKEGQVRCEAKKGSKTASRDFAEQIGKTETLDDTLAPHRWLALRRGVREGALVLRFELPLESFNEQFELFRERLGPDAATREASSLLSELVLDDLEPWLTTILDQDAEAKAIEAACESLTGLLQAPALQARRIAAFFVGRATSPVGVVIADREGELLAKAVLKPEGGWLMKALELIREYNVHHVALPTHAPGAELLHEIDSELAKNELQVTRIRPAAIAEARLPLTDPPMRLTQTVASSLILARRALDPIKEWALIDPVSIGVAEYQNDLNVERLRTALKETVELNRLERRRGGKSSSGGGASAGAHAGLGRGSTTMARLNPLVKTIADLRGGMTVHGVVTNISHFGAFVNIGLPQEALVHISELSDRFVSNPNEVVSISQQVTAQVLAVDPSRGRISLSMKTQRRMPAGAAGLQREGRPEDSRPSGGRPPSSGGGDQRSGGGAPPRSRAEALASLERLFKK